MIDYLLVLGISLIVRLYPVRSSMAAFDTYGHIYYASEVKGQNAGPWGVILPKSWSPGEMHHPFFWHWLVGLFPINKVLKYHNWVNGAIDSLFSVFVYTLLIRLEVNQQTAWLGVLLYLFTPMWFSSLSMGPRVNSLTPRLFSELCLNLMFVVLLLDIGIPEWAQITITIALSFVILISSKFGLQALLFLVPIVSLFEFSAKPLIAALGGVILAALLSRGRIIKMLSRQLTHLTEYYHRNMVSATSISDRNQFLKIFRRAGSSKDDWRTILMKLITVNSYTAVIIKMPVYIAALILIISGVISQKVGLSSPLITPVLAATIVYILINRPRLLFLGEAERYLNHVAVFIVVASIFLAMQTNSIWVLWALVVYGVVFWFLEVIILDRVSSSKRRKEADDVVEEFLLSGSKSRLIFSFPYHNFCLYRVMLCTPHHVIFPYHMSAEVRNNFVEHFEYCQPYLNLGKLDEIENETGCDTLIIDKRAASAEGFGDWLPSKRWKKVNLEQSVYDIYER
jgi:hypothetical protein